MTASLFCLSCPVYFNISPFFSLWPGGTRGKEPTCQCRRHKSHRFHPWVRKIPWRWKWLPTPVFLPGESHGQRSLAGYSPWGHKELDTTEQVILSCISKMLFINCKIFHHCLKDLSEIRTHLGFTVSLPPPPPPQTSR